MDIFHPDPGSAGGILGTKQVGDLAEEYGIGCAVHFASTLVACMAGVHGVPKPIVNRGFITVPDWAGAGCNAERRGGEGAPGVEYGVL